MKPESLSQLTDQELEIKLKSLKNNKIIDATLIGLSFGIVFYVLINKGLGLFSILPIIFAYIVLRNSKNNKILENEIQKEMNSRIIK